MTVLATNLAQEEGVTSDMTPNDHGDGVLDSDMPQWAEDHDWGEPLMIDEWDDSDSYRAKNGWAGRDLVHDRHSPVRILEYFVQWGSGEGTPFKKGGVGTTLTGIAHFTKRAESHRGFCHGGSMCSLMDDIVGWTGFVATGKCCPWTGFTVQINTSLKKPIRVDSFLVLKATITNIERRKVSVKAELIDPEVETNNVHAVGEGLVILNRGILEEEHQQEQQFASS